MSWSFVNGEQQEFIITSLITHYLILYSVTHFTDLKSAALFLIRVFRQPVNVSVLLPLPVVTAFCSFLHVFLQTTAHWVPLSLTNRVSLWFISTIAVWRDHPGGAALRKRDHLEERYSTWVTAPGQTPLRASPTQAQRDIVLTSFTPGELFYSSGIKNN